MLVISISYIDGLLKAIVGTRGCPSTGRESARRHD
jgi:hypothetical protein